MSEKFTASNGVDITITPEGIDTFLLGKGGIIRGGDRRWTVATGNKDGIDALREFFLHERDQELGRWRWPENPEYVVYPDGTSRRVVRESTGQMMPVSLHDRKMMTTYLESWVGAAKAYDAAHEPAKPWHDAKPGEVWVITTENVADEVSVQVTPEGTFQYNDGSAWLIADMPIVSARRIWPEAVES